MNNCALQFEPLRRFQVRDISSSYAGPAFDLVFHDDEHKVERYSEAIWNSEHDATVEAERLEAAELRPTHWDVLRSK